jgi:hypothetical protein
MELTLSPESRSNIVKSFSLSIGGAEACDLFVKKSQIENRRESQTRVASSQTSRKKKRGLHVEPMRFLERKLHRLR